MLLLEAINNNFSLEMNKDKKKNFLDVSYSFFTFDFIENLIIRNPPVADIIDADKIAIFATLRKSTLSKNAKPAMKFDIVKPIPPRKHIPSICVQLIFFGKLKNFVFE